MQDTITMRSIASKVHQGIRINEHDALWLYQSADLGELGNLANTINLRKNGKAVFYNVNRHINPTNICALSCKFCAYSKKIGEEGGYAYEIDEMIAKAGEAIAQGATELHMVGGLHPRWGFQRYVDMIAALRNAYPDIHLKAFTAVELDWMARKARKSVGQVIEELRAAGLNSFPGGGAEIFHPDVRDVICDTKVSGEQWIDTHRTAHKLGMRSNCTMLYGHIETYEHRVDHMRMLRDLQDETGGFNVFIPLSFQPFQNEMGIDRYTFGSDDLRNIAVSRLYLDNFKHIKSYWVMLGQDVAQLALNFGANDLDGTVLEEKISRAAGGRSGMIMTRSNLESLIRRSGRIPVERTTLYEPVRDTDRAHLVPDYSAGHSLAGDLLVRIKDGALLSAHEIWQLASTATLNQLVDAVSDLQGPARLEDAQSFGETILLNAAECKNLDSFEQLVSLKIGDIAATSLAADSASISVTLTVSNTITHDLRDIVRSIRKSAPQSPVILSGLHGVANAWQSFDSSLKLKFSEFLFDLHQLGVQRLAGTADDTLRYQGQGVLDEIGAIALAMDLRLSVTIPVSASNESPDWSDFANALAHIRSFCQRFNHCVITDIAKADEDSTLMPSEFMMAIALARLTLGRQAQIHVPITGIPTLAPTKGLGADAMQHTATKLLSTVCCFGASGIGNVPLGVVHMDRVYEDLRAAGTVPTLRNLYDQVLALRNDKIAKLSSIRHVPPLETRHATLFGANARSNIDILADRSRVPFSS